MLREYEIPAFRTSDTGVWCKDKIYNTDKKIASIGVHLRRYISSHGVGINVTDEVLKYFDAIDACGLGKGVTTMESMLVPTESQTVARGFADSLAQELGVSVQHLRSVKELEEVWGLENGELLETMIQSDLQSPESEGGYITLK
jgi:lipoyl(octanoyl) transferase 2